MQDAEDEDKDSWVHDKADKAKHSAMQGNLSELSSGASGWGDDIEQDVSEEFLWRVYGHHWWKSLKTPTQNSVRHLQKDHKINIWWQKQARKVRNPPFILKEPLRDSHPPPDHPSKIREHSPNSQAYSGGGRNVLLVLWPAACFKGYKRVFKDQGQRTYHEGRYPAGVLRCSRRKSYLLGTLF